MSRVSLILPTTEGDPRPDALVPSVRSALENAGHEVEVIVVCDGLEGPHEGFLSVESRYPGLASSAIAGLQVASGEVLVILDPRMGYAPESLPAVLTPLDRGEAELVVASRYLEGPQSGRLRARIGRFARPFTGTTDPLSGLIAMTRGALESASHFKAVGARFSLEFLSKVQGRRMDVPAIVGSSSRRGLPGWDDLRHLKRLADHQYGNASRLIQFCVVGASGVFVDLTFYALFIKLLSGTPLADYVVPPTQVRLSLAIAAALAVSVALVWNFSLNRRLTFSYARTGSVPRQFAVYAASNLLGVIVSLGFRLLLPRKVAFFNDHKLAAAVVGIVAATGISFSMSRWVVFRPKAGDITRREPGKRPIEPEDAPEPGEVSVPGPGRG